MENSVFFSKFCIRVQTKQKILKAETKMQFRRGWIHVYTQIC